MQRRRGGVVLKSRREIDLMRTANQHVAEVLAIMCEAVAPGISTWDIDQIARAEIDERPVTSAFLGYYGYPATICASVNEQIVHGIPTKKKVLAEGDIIGLDFGLAYEGYVGDSARTVPVGKVGKEAEALVEVTRRSLDAALEICAVGTRLSEIGKSVEGIAQEHGYGIVRDFVGHGIGTRMHEEPQVPNYYEGPRPRMKEGLVIAIEPMLNMGTHKVKVLSDGWTAVTADGSWSAHFEDSVAILPEGPWILSRP